MKNDSPVKNGSTGPVLFRSPEELSGDSEANYWAEREFPEGAADEAPDEETRRDFIKLMTASMAMAGVGLTGCRRPEENIYAFGKQPQDYIHGVPQYFATAMPTRSGAIPLVAKSNDGRPTKVEGNDTHPDSNGGTDVFAQASVLNLYDPDRARRFAKDGSNASRQVVLDELARVGASFASSKGSGLAFLAGHSTSPSRARLRQKISAKFPQATWAEYEPVDFGVHAEAASIATGKSVYPRFRLGKAKRIVSLDCDFLGTEEDTHLYTRDFAKNRRVSTKGPQDDKQMSRLYAAEALMTQTGANADHRLRMPASQVLRFAARLAKTVIVEANFPIGDGLRGLLGRLGEQVPSEFGVDAISDDLLAHPGESLVVAGHRQPLEVHLLAHLINAATGAYGKTVEFVADAAVPAASIRDLAKQLKAGSVDTLVILGANPSYNAPADLDWNVTIDSAKSVIRLADQEDESFASATYHLPQAHYLESWGDARTSDGTLVAVQPLIAPLHGGVTELEVLARILGETSSNPHDIAQATFNSIAKTGGTWKNFLHDGFLAGTASKTVSARVNANDIYGKLKDARVPSAPSADALEIVFARDYSVDDGRYGNNGWLQELPDPVTKMVWDNPVMISRATAVELGLENTDNVTITVDGREVAGAIWVQPGMAEGVIGLPLGYGRTKGGRIANFGEKLVGFNAYKIRTSAFPHISAGAKLGKAEAKYEFASAQEHWAIHGRPIVREANLAQYHKKPDFAKNMGIEAHAKDAGPIYKSPYEDESKKHLKSDLHQWAMSIDLSTCVGCSACVIACQSENNIPIVGKDQVLKRREMHWLRIDRYYTGDPGTIDKEDGKFGVYKDEDQWKHTWIDDPQVVNQPMMCQHCENAPCESVCPVNATAHDTEGLNVMAYNRCVGTRYCSNNCSWKVRRFNWFDYNKRPTDKLYNNNITDFLGLNLNERSDDEMDLLAMARNPDVTVRMRGVMEKCTFCVQRIEQAKIAQKVEAKDSDDVRVKDGAIKTACQQVCPADSIVFGNLLDEDSKVSQLKLDERNYAVLGFLDTKPRVTYLAKVRNPNPAMPGYRDAPLGLDEYRYKHGDPMVSHHGDDHAKEGSSH